MGLPTVQATGIEKRYLRTRALDGVTFDADAGITGFLGPNGAGKTTLLRMVAGDLPVRSGAVAKSGGLGVMRQFIGMIGDRSGRQSDAARAGLRLS